MTPILEARGLKYSYSDGPEALRGVTLSIKEGKKIALVGPNGAGKSTLMLMFNAILRPGSGEVLLNGRPFSYDSSSLKEIRRRVGMVFQNPDDQLFAPTVYQDVAFGPSNLGLSRDRVDKYVGYALSYVGLEGYERRPPHHLSGGEKKRVAIAGVLSMEPEVMILDEPTSNLDPASSEEIMEMLDELNFFGKTILVSTHDVELAYRWADEVVLMNGGRILRHGTPEEVFSEKDLLKQSRMKLPVFMELYEELAGRGMLPLGSPPKSILDLIDLLDHNDKPTSSRTSNGKPGKIYVWDVEFGAAGVREILSRGVVDYVGAMGTRAKLMSEREGIYLDFSYGVIDKCILKALNGKSSLIITSGGMVDHAVRRIRSYVDEFGAGLDVETLNPQEQVPAR